MDTVTILRELWRRRVFVGAIAFAAVFVGLMISYRISLPPESRKYEVGVASARILVDTPNSQVVEVAPTGSETLGGRANLLANLMTEGEVKAAIARGAGLAPKQLLAVAETAAEPQTVPLSAKRNPTAPLLTTRLVTNPTGDPLPIIEIETQAADAPRAARLAVAAVSGLRAYLDSKAAVESVPDARRLRVTGLGAPQARMEVRGPKRVVALAGAIFIFLLGCAAIIGLSALVRNWHAASEEDELGDVEVYRALLDVPLDGERLTTATEGDGGGADWSTLVLTPLPGGETGLDQQAAGEGESGAGSEAGARSA